MPVRKGRDGWYWGSKGPFPTKAKAAEVGKAVYGTDYKKKKKK